MFFPFSGRSAAWLARLPWEQEVAGSNPAAPTTKASKISTLGKCLTCFFYCFAASLPFIYPMSTPPITHAQKRFEQNNIQIIAVVSTA